MISIYITYVTPTISTNTSTQQTNGYATATANNPYNYQNVTYIWWYTNSQQNIVKLPSSYYIPVDSSNQTIKITNNALLNDFKNNSVTLSVTIQSKTNASFPQSGFANPVTISFTVSAIEATATNDEVTSQTTTAVANTSNQYSIIVGQSQSFNAKVKNQSYFSSLDIRPTLSVYVYGYTNSSESAPSGFTLPASTTSILISHLSSGMTPQDLMNLLPSSDKITLINHIVLNFNAGFGNTATITINVVPELSSCQIALSNYGINGTSTPSAVSNHSSIAGGVTIQAAIYSIDNGDVSYNQIAQYIDVNYNASYTVAGHDASSITSSNKTDTTAEFVIPWAGACSVNYQGSLVYNSTYAKYVTTTSISSNQVTLNSKQYVPEFGSYYVNKYHGTDPVTGLKGQQFSLYPSSDKIIKITPAVGLKTPWQYSQNATWIPWQTKAVRILNWPDAYTTSKFYNLTYGVYANNNTSPITDSELTFQGNNFFPFNIENGMPYYGWINVQFSLRSSKFSPNETLYPKQSIAKFLLGGTYQTISVNGGSSSTSMTMNLQKFYLRNQMAELIWSHDFWNNWPSGTSYNGVPGGNDSLKIVMPFWVAYYSQNEQEVSNFNPNIESNDPSQLYTWILKPGFSPDSTYPNYYWAPTYSGYYKFYMVTAMIGEPSYSWFYSNPVTITVNGDNPYNAPVTRYQYQVPQFATLENNQLTFNTSESTTGTANVSLSNGLVLPHGYFYQWNVQYYGTWNTGTTASDTGTKYNGMSPSRINHGLPVANYSTSYNYGVPLGKYGGWYSITAQIVDNTGINGSTQVYTPESPVSAPIFIYVNGPTPTGV